MPSRRIAVHGLAITPDGPALRPAWDAPEDPAASALRGGRETDWDTFWGDVGKRFDDDEGPIDYRVDTDDEEPVGYRYYFDSADARLFVLADGWVRGLTRAEFNSVVYASNSDATEAFWQGESVTGDADRLHWIMFCTLMAHGFLTRDQDYIVLDGQVVMMGDGQPAGPDDYADGFRQAVQAKEGVMIG